MTDDRPKATIQRCRHCGVALEICDCGGGDQGPHWVDREFGSRYCRRGAVPVRLHVPAGTYENVPVIRYSP